MKEKLLEHFEIQNKLNEFLVGKDWKKKISDGKLFMAIISECAELGESIGFKWWTKQKINWKNAKVELVDIWHFLLTYFLMNTNSDKYETIVKKIIQGFEVVKEEEGKNEIEKREDIFTTIDLFLHFLHPVFVKEPSFQFGVLIGLLFDSLEEFDKLYRAKAKLNEERKKKGYNKDSSKKMIGNKEDNEILIEKFYQHKIPFGGEK